MKVSVIIPTYKPQKYLWDCLCSMNEQTMRKEDFEVILVLNGCNQPYYSQILDWKAAHKDLNLNVIQTDQGGVSNARNIALDTAKGEYITFVDDDDYFSTTCLQEMLDIATPDTIVLIQLDFSMMEEKRLFHKLLFFENPLQMAKLLITR